MKISLLNPFTPKAAGVVETKIAEYHNQPHLSAFRALVDKGHVSSIQYFTSRFLKYSFEKEALNCFLINLIILLFNSTSSP